MTTDGTTDSVPPAAPDLPIAAILAELNRKEPYTMEEFHAACLALKKKYAGDPAFNVMADGPAVFARQNGWLKQFEKNRSRLWIMRVPPRAIARASFAPPPPLPAIEPDAERS